MSCDGPDLGRNATQLRGVTQITKKRRTQKAVDHPRWILETIVRQRRRIQGLRYVKPLARPNAELTENVFRSTTSPSVKYTIHRS